MPTPKKRRRRASRTAARAKRASRVTRTRAARSAAAASAQLAPPPTDRQLDLARFFEAGRSAAYDRAPRRAAPQRTIKVVAEGDSWFSYFPAYDILAQLRHKSWGSVAYKVRDRARAGALLNDMVYGRDMLDTYELIADHKPDAFLFSGGGNDIAGPELFVMLYHHKAVNTSSGLSEINANILQGIVNEIFHRAYADLIQLIRVQLARIGRPNIPIVFHGYDYPFPDGRGWAGGIFGPWLDPSLTRKGYERPADDVLRRKIVVGLIDAFNAMLAGIAARFPNTHYVDLRETLPNRNQWGNELHPTEDGFLAVARKIEATLRAVA